MTETPTQKTTEHQSLKELGTLLGIITLGALLISLPFGNPATIFLTTIALILFTAPALVWITPARGLDRVEKFAFSFVFSFGLGAVWFLNEVTLRVPYTTTTLLVLDVIVLLAGLLFWKKEYFTKKERALLGS